ncbi:DNA internalization-related competence protein ComEC/Rec2 [Companilactobacillus alimentarius DSM 20249]|uniref:DNA internalization-related competence protein ComEC/Rec2 n=3 Tax=Companilactobacillus alimentarius TaxID=1602 RepID=A0A2K9HJR1_9LACO|nr:DNA internalization-related competence protein ComEC/Rec2 [Companilactobacillus alimentarius DSM 20249]
MIFPALAIILLITIYFQTKWFTIFLIILMIRISLLKNWQLDLLVISLILIFAIRCQTLKVVPDMPQITTGLISPDKVNINGDILSGEMETTSQSVKFIYRIKTQTEQKRWQNLERMVSVQPVIKEIKPVTKPRNIGEFNYAKYLANKNINYNVQIDRFKSIKEFEPQKIEDRINVLRIHIIKYLAKLPKWLRIHAQSLIVGYTGSDNKDFLKILSALGIIHLFSLSGLHVLIILTILRKLTSFFRIPVEWVDFLMLFILPMYGILVGSKSGIWRAIVLTLVSIILKKLRISLSRLDIFSITMIICLFIYPFGIIEMGGQLSFLLAFAILYLYKGSNFFQMTFKMNLVSLPIICFYTYQINWLTLLVNLIFIPFFSYVILPITLISSLTVNWHFWSIINSTFEKMYVTLDFFANNSFFVLITGKFPSWLVIVLLIISLFYVESKMILNKYLFHYLALILFCIALNKFPIFGSVNIIDVGQGDSILITTPLVRRTFLIDVGGKLNFSTKSWAKRLSHDQVETTTLPFLKSKGISHIDRLFLTHKDVDHIGNVETLLKNFSVRQINFGIGLEQNKRIKKLIRKYPQIKFIGHKQGDVLNTGSIKWQVLWPKHRGIGENSDSLTLLASIKHRRWLFTGDLDIASEKKILQDYHFKVDYLKLGHHGSKTSMGEQLLSTIQPKLGFISAGVDNRYGHPNQETLIRLKKHRVKYLNTAEYGMISWYYNFFDDKEEITTFLKGDLIEDSRVKK